MSQRGRCSLPIPLRDVLQEQASADEADVLWQRVQRARGRAPQAEPLPLPLSQVLAAPESPSVVRARHRLLRARRTAKPTRNPLLRNLALAGVMLGVLALVFVGSDAWPSPASEMQPGVAHTAPPAASISYDELPKEVRAQDQSVEVVLADASRIRLSPGSRLIPLASSESRVDLLLEEGEAHFSVTPGGPRRWTIEAGIGRIEVVGTVFDVVRRADEVSVSVARGAVLVRSALLPHGVTRLAAGEAVNLAPKPPQHDAEASAESNANTAARADDSAAVSTQAVPSTQSAHSKPSPPPPARAQSNWQAAYDAGQFETAYRLIDHQHFARTVQASTSPEELLKLADLARLSGHVAHSVLPLERITTDFKHSAHAPIAAFTLGRIHLDQLHDAKAAAQTFELAIALKPPLALLEDCHARLVRAYAASGDTAKAREAAARYGALFPTGRHLRDLERFKAGE